MEINYLMSKSNFLRLLDELLENEPGTLKGGEELVSIPRWDSLAVIGFIALLDQHFGLSVPGSKIAECKSVDDLVRLAGDRIQD